MTNNEIIYNFVAGNRKQAAANHIGYMNNELFSYSTVICRIDRENKKAELNTKKYSRTTSKHQSYLRYTLEHFGYAIKEYDGPDCMYWNWGYMGAPALTVEDLKKLA